jgi:two-component sensor histidine kinase
VGKTVLRISWLPVIPLRWGILAAVCLFSGNLYIYSIPDHSLRMVVHDFYFTFESLVAMGVMLYSYWHTARIDQRLSKVWGAWSIGVLCYLTGSLVWMVREVFLNKPATPSLVDVCFVGFYIFMWRGLITYPMDPSNPHKKFLFLDNCIVCLASALSLWSFLVQPLIKTNLNTPFTAILALIYPTTDMALMWVALAFFRRSPDRTTYPPLAPMAAAITATIAADTLYGYQTLMGTFSSGSMVGVGWALALMALIVGGFAQVSQLSKAHAPQPQRLTTSDQPDRVWSIYLPYLWLLVALAILLFRSHSPADDPVTYCGIILTIVLVVARQVLTINDNLLLYSRAQRELAERRAAQEALRLAHDDLEVRVRQRTEDLSIANSQLRDANVTLHLEVAERERVERDLRRRSEMDQLLKTISTKLINQPLLQVQNEIDQTLAQLGEYMQVDRCHLVQYDSIQKGFLHRNEWMRAGIQPRSKPQQSFSEEAGSWLYDQLSLLKAVVIDDIYQMDEDAAQEKEFLLGEEVRSILIAPLIIDQRQMGFLRVETAEEERTWSEEDIWLVKNAADLLTLAVRQGLLQQEIHQHLKDLEESLGEKDVLLKEIHHRVKNNLQIISSLIAMQSRRIKNPAALSVLQDSQLRVRSMALIHERLYQSENLANIHFSSYIEGLASFLFRSYQDMAGRVRLETEVDQVALDIDTAVPMGLILNELITNSLKYAFPGKRTGTIKIQLQQRPRGYLTLVCADDGVGLPEGLDIDNTDQLGIQLVKTLVQQLDGIMEVSRKEGVSFQICFPHLDAQEPVTRLAEGLSQEADIL